MEGTGPCPLLGIREDSDLSDAVRAGHHGRWRFGSLKGPGRTGLVNKSKNK